MLKQIDQVTTGRLILPKTFSGLMDLYEQNFLRMRRLAPDLGIADEMISLAPGHLDLYLTVEERCKYTSTVNMTYAFHDQQREIRQPDMHIRIYHDARIAEAQDRLLHRKQRRIYSHEGIAAKWQLNRFLYKWLGYCIYQQHYFHPVSNLNRLGNEK